MPDETTPEGKLLKLIRRRTTGASKPESAGGAAAGGVGVIPEQYFLVFKNADRLLTALVIILAVYLVRELTSEKQFEIMLPPIEEEVKTPEPLVIQLGATPQPFTYYEQKMNQRNIFDPVDTSQSQTQQPQNSIIEIPPAVVMLDLTKKLKLVGIVLGDEAEAIIEDLEDKSTHFLHKGDRIEDAVLEDIQEGKVIFQFNNQQIEFVQ